jgi:hypothetical protein
MLWSVSVLAARGMDKQGRKIITGLLFNEEYVNCNVDQNYVVVILWHMHVYVCTAS